MPRRLLQRPLACLLALAVFAAQAACACRHAWAAEASAAPPTAMKATAGTGDAAVHACCRHDKRPSESPPVPATNDPAPGCPHCDGSAALKSTVPANAAPAVDLSPAVLLAVPFELAAWTPTLLSSVPDRDRLAFGPPPPSTLLALRCALTL